MGSPETLFRPNGDTDPPQHQAPPRVPTRRVVMDMATVSLNLHMDLTLVDHRLRLRERIRGRPAARRMTMSIRHNGDTVQPSRKVPLRLSRRRSSMTTAMLSPNLGMDSIRVHHRVPVWTSTCGRLTAGRMAITIPT